MKRFAPALAALLLACAPPSDDGDAAAPASSGEAPAASKPRAPKPALEKTPANRSKATLQADASYYQYVDESGHVRFAATLEDVPERQRSTAGQISVAAPTTTRSATTARRPAAAEAEVATNAEVVLYTTQSCPYCKRAIAYLEQIGQDYVNKDVDQDERARDEYLELTGGRPGVPVIVVGDQWMQGWSQGHLDQLLAASR